MCTKFYEFMKKAFACGPDIMVKHCIHLGYMAPGSRVGNTRRQLMHTKWAPINLCVESNRYLSEYLGVLRFHVCSLCGWYIRHFWLNIKRINTFYLVCRHIKVDLMELQNTLQFYEVPWENLRKGVENVFSKLLQIFQQIHRSKSLKLN